MCTGAPNRSKSTLLNKAAMDFRLYYPNNDTLKKYIDYYYFFKNSDPSFSRTYYSFPNRSMAINIHQNVRARVQERGTNVRGVEESNYVIIATHVRDRPLKVEWRGKLDKVTIAFKPLGLNNFISEPFALAMPSPIHLFTAWEKTPGYTAFLDAFYDTADLAMRVDLLEAFLLRLYTPLPEQTILEKALGLLSNFDVPLAVNEVAAQVNLSERTFNRLFARQVGISPVAYRKVARFRKSLENKLLHGRFKKLTEVAYDSHFYDQSYFIRIYNQLAGTHPKAFFDAVSTVAEDRVVLQFVP